MVAVRKISSDCTSLSYAIEETITKLPSNPVWRMLSPNSYSGDFGAVVEYDSDEPIGSGRMSKKGAPVNKMVSAGFESTVRQNWLQPFMPGFFFNFAIETPNTNTFNPKATGNATLASVSADAYVGTDLGDFKANTLVVGQNFEQTANNGLHVVSAASATNITTAGLVVEASPPSNASVETCGLVATTPVPALTINGNEITIAVDKLKSGGDLELSPGTFIHIGGDVANTRYSSDENFGWARIRRVTSTGIVCDLTSFVPKANAATGLNTLQIFIPTRVYRNHIDCDDSRRTTYQLERRLGKSDTADTHEQGQLVTGMVPNQLDFAIPTSGKMMTTMSFVGAESYRRDGSTALWSGTDREAYDRAPFLNTSSDIKYAQLYRHDSSTANREQLFGLITDGTFTLNNNCSPIPGWGVYGAWDINVGKLNVNCDVTALFTTVKALDLAEEGIDAGLYVVFARGNAGFVLDIPLVTVQASPLAVEVNTPINVSLTNMGNESIFGYGASLQFFDYLPTAATAVTRS